MKRTITVSGTGEVRAAPDLARLEIGVEATAATAKEARTVANSAAEALLAALRALSISDGDIATESLSVQPQYDYSGNGPRLTGYLVANGFRVVVRDVERVGDVLDAALDAAGDAGRLRAIGFGLADTETMLARARILAMRDARKRALAFAAGAGVELGRLLSIDEAGEPGPSPRMALKMERAAAGGTPVEVGESAVRAVVVARYAIKTSG